MTASSNLLFSWADVERRPELQRLQRVLDTMPDGDILNALEARRGHGRDDDPVVAMWRAMLAGIVFQHESAQSLLRELQRNPALLALCGFPALPRQSAPKRGVSEADGSTVIYLPQPLRDPAPDACNFSRFLRVVVELEEEQGMIAAMIRTMREQLMEEADDFGEFLGYDGKAMESHSTGARNRATGKTSDADADWGKHETHGIHAKTGKPWKKIKSWFGYRVHTIADMQYRNPGGGQRDPGFGVGSQGTGAAFGAALRGDPGPGGALQGVQRRPRPRQRPTESHALGPAPDPPADRQPGAVERRKEASGLRPGQADFASALPGSQRLHSPYRERGSDLQVPGHRNRAPDGVPGVRGRPLDAQMPLPGRRLRLRMRGTGRLPQMRRLQGGGVRPGGPHRPGEAQPPHLHSDPAGQPLLAARIQSPERDGAHLQPPRQWLPVRAPHHSRRAEDDRPGRPRDGGHVGPGARPSPRWPQATNAIPGWRHTGPRQRIEFPTASPPKPLGSETGPRPASAELKPTLAPRRRRKAAKGRCRPRQLPHERLPEQKNWLQRKRLFLES